MRYRMRALAMLALAAFLTALTVPALGQSPRGKLVRLTFYYPVGVAGPLARVIGDMTDQFNKANAGAIEVVPVYSGDYDPTLQKVQTAVMAGNPPDVFIVEISELHTLLAMNAIIPLDDYVKRAEGGKYWEDFFPAFRENSVVRGKIWWIPFQRSTPVLYWNKEAFKRAGLDPDRAPATWDELRETAKKLTVREGNEVRQWGVTVSGGWNDWLFEAFVRQNGGWLINNDGNKANFSSPEAVQALEFWVELMHKEKVGPPHSTWASTPPDFVAGRTAMLYHSTGILTFLKNSAKFDFGVGFMPAKKSFGAEVGGGNLAISRRIPKDRQDAAWRFIEWMTSSDNAAKWSIASGYVATRQSSYNVADMKAHVEKNPQYLVARDQLKYASAKMMAPNYQKIREVLKRQLDDAVDGRVPPKEALDAVQKQVTTLIAR